MLAELKVKEINSRTFKDFVQVRKSLIQGLFKVIYQETEGLKRSCYKTVNINVKLFKWQLLNELQTALAFLRHEQNRLQNVQFLNK